MVKIFPSGHGIGTPSAPAWLFIRILKNFRQYCASPLVIDRKGLRTYYDHAGRIVWLLNEDKRAEDSKVGADILQSVSESLGEMANVLTKLEPGLQLMNEKSAAAGLLLVAFREITSSNPGDALVRLSKFRVEAEMIEKAAAEAGTQLRTLKGKRGRRKSEGYEAFLNLAHTFAERFGMSTKIESSRDGQLGSGEKGGPFVALVMMMEFFLPSEYRSKTPDACAQRIKRARKAT